jgi:hypothetical protein
MDHQRWRDNLLVLGPEDALRTAVPRTRSAVEGVLAQLRAADPRSGVVLDGRVGTTGVRAVARSLGVQVEREFLAFPSHASPAYLVESTPAAVEYFCSCILTVPPRTTWMTLPIDLGLRALQRSAPREMLRAMTPSRVVVGGTGDPSRGSPERDRYRSLWSYPGVDDLDLIVIGTSKDPNAKVTVLGIEPGGGGPSIAMKVPTTDVARDAVETEGHLLVDLQRRRPTHVLSTIPRVIDLVLFEGRRGLVTAGLGGRPMSASYLRWRHCADPRTVSADLNAVSRWLASFQRDTSGARSPIDICAGLTERLSARFADEPSLAEDLEALARIDRRLREEAAPRTAVHGDLWFGNILLRGGEVSGVIDWEFGAISGEPLRDLVRFALVYAAYLDRHTRSGGRVAGHRKLRADAWGAGIRFAVDGSGWFPDLLRAFVTEGLERLGVDRRRWRDALLAGLLEIAATADHQDFARQHLRLFHQLEGSLERTSEPSEKQVVRR